MSRVDPSLLLLLAQGALLLVLRVVRLRRQRNRRVLVLWAQRYIRLRRQAALVHAVRVLLRRRQVVQVVRRARLLREVLCRSGVSVQARGGRVREHVFRGALALIQIPGTRNACEN